MERDPAETSSTPVADSTREGMAERSLPRATAARIRTAARRAASGREPDDPLNDESYWREFYAQNMEEIPEDIMRSPAYEEIERVELPEGMSATYLRRVPEHGLVAGPKQELVSFAEQPPGEAAS